MTAVTDATAQASRDAAGTDLYRRDAFRHTGPSTTAHRRAVRRRRQRRAATPEAGVDPAHPAVPAAPVDTGALTPGRR